MNTKLYVGLDVHKDSIAVAIAKADGSPPQSCGSWGGSNLSAERGLLRLRKKFGVSKEEISVACTAWRASALPRAQRSRRARAAG